MYNAGEATVTYEVDTGPLEALSTANYLVPVLQCLAGQGEVPPRGAASLPFIFSPLEAKTYSVSWCICSYVAIGRCLHYNMHFPTSQLLSAMPGKWQYTYIY